MTFSFAKKTIYKRRQAIELRVRIAIFMLRFAFALQLKRSTFVNTYVNVLPDKLIYHTYSTYLETIMQQQIIPLHN